MFTLDHVAAFGDPTFQAAADPVRGSSAVTPGASHYLGLVKVTALPAGISNRTNLRNADTKTKVSKEVAISLRSNDGLFHLKNKGITLLASDVRCVNPATRTYEVAIGGQASKTGDGIVDGGHTYAIIQEALAAGSTLDKQYVFVSVRVNLPAGVIPFMAEGLNKSTPVSAGSLAHHLDEYDWLRKRLPEDVAARVAWRQNDTGDVKAEELVAILFALQADRGDGVVSAYASRAKPLGEMRSDRSRFSQQRPLIIPALRLYEHIAADLAEDLEKTLQSKRAVETRKSRALLFSSKHNNVFVRRGIALPVFASFRAVVQTNGNVDYFDRPWDELIKLYDAAKPALLGCVKTEWAARGTDPGAFGKSKDTWRALLKALEAVVAQQPAVTVQALPDDDDDLISAKHADLHYQWSFELEEELEKEQTIREEIQSCGDPRTRADLENLRKLSENRAGQLQGVLDVIEEGRFGFCQICNGRVAEERLEEATCALNCSKCAGAHGPVYA